MASTAEIFETILSRSPPAPHGIAYNYLVPNVRGLQSLVSILEKSQSTSSPSYPTPPPSPSPEQTSSHINTTEISLFAAATEAFSQANTNCTIAESLARSLPIIDLAKEH